MGEYLGICRAQYALFVLAGAVAAPSAQAQEFSRPTGAYALGNVGQVPSESVIDLPFVDGWARRC